MATSDAPISIGSVTLIVNDLEQVSRFYRAVVGLDEIAKDATHCSLGQGDSELLKLIEDKQARRYPREAGLFHTAFLLPDRVALAEWYVFSKSNYIKLDGAADHSVSEALYLSDPEGNGVELYADRDRSNWKIQNDQIDIPSIRLDFSALSESAQKPWVGVPEGTVIGHVHLQVGNIEQADDFFVNQLGMDLTAQIPSAHFYSTGGYHHHLAGNTWNSYGATQRSANAAGLNEVELLVSEPDTINLHETVDPWGTHIKFKHCY